MRLLQVMNSFPALLLAMLVISALGRGILNVILVVALIPLPDYVRLARAEILTKKNWQFAEAAAHDRPPPGRGAVPAPGPQQHAAAARLRRRSTPPG